MSLFNVPGWTVSTTPLVKTSTRTSKKRKRPSSDTLQLQTAEVNFEKLVKTLKVTSPASIEDVRSTKGSGKHPVNTKSDKRRGTKSKSKTNAADKGQKETIPHPKVRRGSGKDHNTLSGQTNETKVKYPMSESSTGSPMKQAVATPTIGLTPLQQSMKGSLEGARFRMINESLYKMNGQQAHQMVQKDPQIYEEYHIGFRHQVRSWPTNPVDYYISTLSTYPPKTVIADLGCGDAAIARALIPKNITVLSFDLVSDGAFVVEADTCNNIPLPGSEGTEDEKSYGEGHIVDVVVCALSLMGTNWPNCLREAWRVLKADGELKIAEVASRFTDLEGFRTLIGSIGFRLISKDESNSHFILFEFKKVSMKRKSEKEWAKVLLKAGVLKPCEYKRR